MHPVHIAEIPGNFEGPLRLAVLSDLHLGESAEDLLSAGRLLDSINNNSPDLIVILGDLIASPTSLHDATAHRRKVTGLLASFSRQNTVFVLGNYESWDDRDAWLLTLTKEGFSVLENKVTIFPMSAGSVCVRGLGDFYTGYYQPTPFPKECNDLASLTIAHDPAAAFQPGVEGLVIAGHTHCGQVSLPLIGPLWAPTEAPREAWCGLYQDELRTLWVSSGVGTSILPIRLGAPSQWDLIEVTFKATGGR